MTQVERPESAAEEETTPWPLEVTDLTATVESFETTEACTEELRERLPVEVTDLISDLGYDALLDDACRSVGAVRSGSPEACDALSVSAVRNGCRIRLAVFHRRSEACPVVTRGAGRDPSCLAWASRDPELCRGAGSAEGAICRAVFENDVGACDAVRGDLRSRCRARVGRFGAVLGDERQEVMDEIDVLFRLTVRDENTTGEEIVVEGDDAARGVVLEYEGCVRRLEIGDVGVLRPHVPKASLSLVIPLGAPLPLRIPLGGTAARVVLAVPGRGIGDSLPGGSGALIVEALGATIGGKIAITIDAEINLPLGRVSIEGRLETFVRDIGPLPTGCEEETPSAE